MREQLACGISPTVARGSCPRKQRAATLSVMPHIPAVRFTGGHIDALDGLVVHGSLRSFH